MDNFTIRGADTSDLYFTTILSLSQITRDPPKIPI